VNELVENQYVATYRTAEDREWRIQDGIGVERGQAADAGDGETMSTCDILYPHVHAHTRWSFSLRLGSLALQDDAAYSHHDAAGVKGLAVLTAHGDDQFHESRGLCTSSVLTATYP
jgi:hypothetical protein